MKLAKKTTLTARHAVNIFIQKILYKNIILI